LSGSMESLGREINPHVFTEKEFRARLVQKDQFIARVMQTPRLMLVGDDHDLAGMGDQ